MGILIRSYPGPVVRGTHIVYELDYNVRIIVLVSGQPPFLYL